MITIKSRYGKTMHFAADGEHTSVTLRDSDGEFMQNLMFNPAEMKLLTGFLAPAPVAPLVEEYYLIRQRKDDSLRLKVMFANNSTSKLFQSKRLADEHKVRMTSQHGEKYNFFVVKKEA